eukprot:s3091_g3.t2
MVKLLTRHGADLSLEASRTNSPWMRNIEYRTNIQEVLRDAVKANRLLVSSAKDGYWKGVFQAIDHGAWLDLPDESQRTALAWASSHGNARAVRELLQAGASVDLRDTCGWTPLAWAVRSDHQGDNNIFKSSLDGYAGAFGAHTACFPDDLVQQVLPCFNFQAEDGINTYFIDTLELCQISRATPDNRSHLLSTHGHPWSQLPGCVPEMACRCVGAYLLKARRVEQGLTALKTRLVTDVPRLRNATWTAARWQLPLRRRRGTGATVWEAQEMFWRKFAGFRYSLHKTGSLGVNLADSSEPMADGIATLGSELLGNFKLTKQHSTYQLQVRHGNSCALELFHGTCEHPHFGVFEAFPPVQGPAEQGTLLDFLGISSSVSAHCEEIPAWERQQLPLPRTWPVLDEEYLEWADVLKSAWEAAEHQRPLRVADIGAGSYGIWASRAAKAFVRRADPRLGCELLLVEPFENRCEFKVETRQLKTSAELKALLAPGDPWDLLDIDAQGMEKPFLQGIVAWLRQRVRRLHISTHDRAIHWEILQWLKEMGAHNNWPKVASVLEHHKADLHTRTFTGDTLAHLAAKSNHCFTLALLSLAGVDLDLQDFEGHSPLQATVISGKFVATKCLLLLRANPELRDEGGRSIVALAASHGQHALLENLLPAPLAPKPAAPGPSLKAQARKTVIPGRADVNLEAFKAGRKSLKEEKVDACSTKHGAGIPGASPRLDTSGGGCQSHQSQSW